MFLHDTYYAQHIYRLLQNTLFLRNICNYLRNNKKLTKRTKFGEELAQREES